MRFASVVYFRKFSLAMARDSSFSYFRVVESIEKTKRMSVQFRRRELRCCRDGRPMNVGELRVMHELRVAGLLVRPWCFLNCLRYGRTVSCKAGLQDAILRNRYSHHIGAEPMWWMNMQGVPLERLIAD